MTLDVERLTTALYRRDANVRPSVARRRSWGLYRDEAEAIAREYDRLTQEPKPQRPRYLYHPPYDEEVR